MITGRSFVVFSDDWGRHPSSCQHLFRRIAAHNCVVWVNTIGTRTPGLSRADLSRAVGKLKEWTVGASEPAEGEPVHVLKPFMTPFDRWHPLRRLNAKLLSGAVGKGLAANGAHEPVLVTTIPNACGLVGRLGERASVYYCVDEFSEWPGADRRSMLEMEEELLKKVDLVVATSQRLFDDKSGRHPRVRLLRHGVDWNRFRKGDGEVPPAVREAPRPVYGFTGLVDERIDVPLVNELAQVMPEATFAFVGPRQLPAGPLDERANVRFVPAVCYESVPAVLHAFDVAILPYVENSLTERINPLKLREFLATGIPVVATPLPEVRPYADVVETARGLDEWARALRAAAGEGRARAVERAERVRGEGWDARAEEFGRLCVEAAGPNRVLR